MLVDACVEIPVIDFSPFVTDDLEGKQRVAQEIYRACHQVGFLYLTHHGIPQEAIAHVFDQSRRFFASPDEEKQAIAWSNEMSNCGYVGVERERLDETKPGDLKEAFNVGKEVSAEDVGTENPALVLNQWPAGQDEFRQAVTEFFEVCTEAADRIFRAFAIALQMPESFISDKHQAHNYTLRLLHYPPLANPPKPGQIRAGAHSDYGTLTLLFQDDVGGLEVQTAAGEWISAPSIPDAVLINTGDLTQRWSNDVFRSTKHRVALPQGENVGRDRYSIAFFCQPDAEAEIVCLPSCQSSENPPRYPPVTSGEYLLSRLQATY
ncbi:isopenicillin N synthase family oxygenase [Leptolyngbya sp. FACHB-671]|uniref:isopenicillin N synthase family dioxygenase n=1 Tax=Leptolyngbya sp. FACHB-671 TaxID=2692812 RepID=UPI001685F0B9|nr:isopenicillin N synthase family oxygenase [Leptolyngbya sp. FACHB-671]MBD2069361.1 isopenicillin N synthase family oxygenase [Leptolyngbya sp. FACHB-671]